MLYTHTMLTKYIYIYTQYLCFHSLTFRISPEEVKFKTCAFFHSRHASFGLQGMKELIESFEDCEQTTKELSLLSILLSLCFFFPSRKLYTPCVFGLCFLCLLIKISYLYWLKKDFLHLRDFSVTIWDRCSGVEIDEALVPLFHWRLAGWVNLIILTLRFWVGCKLNSLQLCRWWISSPKI